MKTKIGKINKIILKTFSIVFIFFLILVSHFYISPHALEGNKFWKNIAFSAVTDNVRGFAHSSESQSWVSFNCASDPTIGGQNIFTFGFRNSLVLTEPSMYFSFPNCEENDFGVNIDDTTGAITGRALSDHYGWIDFNHETNPFSPKAFFNSTTKEITGTAYLENLGTVNGGLNFNDSYVDVDGYFHGYMTNNEMGNIKLNCDDSTPTSSHPSCVDSFFKLKYIMPLKIEGLSVPNWSSEQVCSSFANKAILRWETIGDPQSAYQVIIDTDSVIDDDTPHFDSGKVTSPAQQFICPDSSNSCDLDYDTSYYAWVQLWDSVDQARGWVQFNTNNTGHSLNSNEDYNNDNSPDPNLTFTTYQHEFPKPSFTWTPTDIVLGEEVYFEGEALYYTDASPDSNPQTCTDSTCDFTWSSTIGSNISNATNSTTTIIFTQASTGSVILNVNVPGGYNCNKAETVSIEFEIPIWQEVKPE